jgi:hypothetical protein
MSQNHPTLSHPFRKKAYEAVSAALPFAVDPKKITVEPEVSSLPSPIKLRDYAAGVMAAFGSAVEYLGGRRGLPSQNITQTVAVRVPSQPVAPRRPKYYNHPVLNINPRAMVLRRPHDDRSSRQLITFPPERWPRLGHTPRR